LLLTDTDTPPVGAALDNVTVHELLAFDPRLVGLHDREEMETVLVARFRVAV